MVTVGDTTYRINDIVYRNMSNEVEDVLMLEVKRIFDPLFEALWRIGSVITSS
jgi:hypothetical protein